MSNPDRTKEYYDDSIEFVDRWLKETKTSKDDEYEKLIKESFEKEEVEFDENEEDL